MLPITIYHNGECSKSRGALELLQEHGIPHEVRWYLDEPLSIKELSALLKKLKLDPVHIVRKTEPLYKEQYEGKEISDEEWLAILERNPILIERPIVASEKTAVIGRPAEKIFELLNSSGSLD